MGAQQWEWLRRQRDRLRRPDYVAGTFAVLGVLLLLVWWQAQHRQVTPCPGQIGIVNLAPVVNIWVAVALEVVAMAVYWWLSTVYRRRPGDDPDAPLVELPLGSLGQVLLPLGALVTASGVLAIALALLTHSSLTCTQ